MTKLLTTDELAEFLGVSDTTIFRLRQMGCPYLKVVNSVRFEPEEVMKWLKEYEKTRVGDTKNSD